MALGCCRRLLGGAVALGLGSAERDRAVVRGIDDGRRGVSTGDQLGRKAARTLLAALQRRGNHGKAE